jgi:hypothetical protein
VTDLFRVEENLVELTELGERGYNLVGDVGTEVDRQCELGIGDSD